MKKTKLCILLLSLFIANAYSQVPTAGLVAYYPFNGNANDASGNLNHGLVTNATLAPNRFGDNNKAYYFNGTNSRIEINHNSSQIDLTNTFTLSFWVKAFQGYNTRSALFYTRQDNSGSDQGGIGVDYAYPGMDSSIFAYKPNYAAGDITLNTGDAHPSGLTTNIWHNVTFVYKKNQKAYLYIDCSLKDSSVALTSFFAASSPIRIGALINASGWGYFFKGWIDDIRIYNRALSQPEIISVCNETNVGISENDKSESFNIYPNPNKGIFTIEHLNSQKKYIVTISDVLGRTVYLTTIIQQSQKIDVTNQCKNGVYILQIIDEDKKVIETKKIIID